MFGQSNTSTWSAASGYYTGTGCSLVAGVFYGPTWLKGGRLAVSGAKYVKTAFTATKTTQNILKTRKVTKLTQNAKPVLLRTIQSAQKARIIGTAKELKNVFPKNPAKFLPNAIRDKKGYIYASDKIRIKPHKHPLKAGDIYNPRHHGQHYHVEIRTDVSRSWRNENCTYYLKPDNYKNGMGTGFIPGELFPGG